MPETFVKSWEYLGSEIYQPLADLEEEPPTSDVFAACAELLLITVQKAYELQFTAMLSPSDDGEAEPAFVEDAERTKLFIEQIESLQDEENQQQSLDVLCDIQLPSFIGDLVIVDYLETVHDLLANEYDERWGNLFAGNVLAFVGKYNLAYKVTTPFEIMPLITSEVARIYQLVQSFPGEHGDLHDLWFEFEKAYSQLIKIGGDPKIPLSKAIIFLEGFASDHIEQRGRSLGDVLNECERRCLFPHKKTIKDSLSKLYGFTSNYPGIRHAGNPESIIRPLTVVDTTFISLLFFVWAGYVRSLTHEDGAADAVLDEG